MSYPKWLLSAIGGLGFALMAASVGMAFFVDHHWYITYNLALFFEGTGKWVQFAGGALWLIGCIGLAAKVTGRAALLAGVGFAITALLVALLFGGTSILNVHNWRISLLLPTFLVFLCGAMLSIAGLLRA